jgi:hypothetical protein
MPTEGSRGKLSPPHKRIIDGFDQAAKGLAEGTISRGRALKLAGSALLGGGLLALSPGVAGAQVSVEAVCEGKPAISNKACPSSRCGDPSSSCFCAKTVSGAKKCVNLENAQCPPQDQCDRNRDCATGEVCIQVGGCECGHPRRNLCVPKCS